MSKQLPYFPFYPKDFAADGKVEAMTTLEVGAYMLLLCKAWHETPPCSVPDDDFVLARWARLTETEWSQARTRIRACWQLRDGRLYQPRLEAEYRKIAEASNRNARNAKTRWEKEKTMRPHCGRNAIALRSHCHPESDSEVKTPSPSAHEREAPLATAGPAERVPPWWDMCKAELDNWSRAARNGQPMQATRGEPQRLLTALRALETGPPIAPPKANGEAIADVIRSLAELGKPWKGPEWVAKVIQGEVENWRTNGRPTTSAAYRGSSNSKETPEQRRARRAAQEFAED